MNPKVDVHPKSAQPRDGAPGVQPQGPLGSQGASGDWLFSGSGSTALAIQSADAAGSSMTEGGCVGVSGFAAAEAAAVGSSSSLEVTEKCGVPHIEFTEVDIERSRKPSLYVMFVLLGCTSLICWNFVIQTLPFILLQKLRRPELNNLFLGVFQVANLFMQVILMFLSKPRPLLVVSASAGSGALGLVLAAAVAIMPSQADLSMDVHLKEAPSLTEPLTSEQKWLMAVMLILSILMGCCQGLIQGVGYTLSCHIAPGYVASVSLGQGAAGLLVFGISTMSCFLLFDINTPEGLRGHCFMSFAIVAVTAFSFALFFFFRSKRPDIHESLARVSHSNSLPAEEVQPSDRRLDSPLAVTKKATWGFQVWGRGLQPQHQPRTRRLEALWLRVFLASWKELALAFFHFSYTYHLYPSVGPLGWRYSWTFPNQIVVLYGVWFLFETIGRAAPDFGWVKGLKWLRPSRRVYGPLSISTLVFLAPFLLGYLLEPGSFLTDPIWYMFVMMSFAFCHGWIGTLAFFYACNAVDDPRERMVAGPLTVLAVGFGCVIGFLSSLAY